VILPSRRTYHCCFPCVCYIADPAPPFACAADLLKLTLAGQGLGTTLTFLYYARTLRVWMVPVELAVNAITFLVPALDLGTPQAVKVRRCCHA
jgi:hypothetical protein